MPLIKANTDYTGRMLISGDIIMKSSNMASATEMNETVERDLRNELDTWYELLNRFYGYHDDELDFDIVASGEEGRNYIRMLEKLQEESARSIALIQSRAMSSEASATSLDELRKISGKVRLALRERDRLRIIGSRALAEMLAL